MRSQTDVRILALVFICTHDEQGTILSLAATRITGQVNHPMQPKTEWDKKNLRVPETWPDGAYHKTINKPISIANQSSKTR